MDGDGLNDREDKCPTETGTIANNGCPEIREEVKEKVSIAAKNIFFMSGRNELTKDSYGALDAVAEELQQDLTLKLEIEGHTDSTGSTAINKILSQERADVVMKYLKEKGIDASRLKATGYGSDRPVSTNDTPEGRRKNRRVELKLEHSFK